MNTGIPPLDISHFSATLELLEGHLAASRRTGRPPERGYLASGEWTALAIAAEREDLITNPIGAFLLLDGCLQRWVMEARGWSHLAGVGLGT